MPENMFDGFDHTRYQDEVETRWGKKAYADGDRWWRGLSAEEKAAWKQRVADLGADWIALAEAGADPASPEAQDVARRHVEWLTGIPGTPAYGAGGDRKAYVIGLGEMYVADPRFGANYATDADRAGSGEQGTAARSSSATPRIYADGNLYRIRSWVAVRRTPPATEPTRRSPARARSSRCSFAAARSTTRATFRRPG
jgi:hypothetical protein